MRCTDLKIEHDHDDDQRHHDDGPDDAHEPAPLDGRVPPYDTPGSVRDRVAMRRDRARGSYGSGAAEGGGEVAVVVDDDPVEAEPAGEQRELLGQRARDRRRVVAGLGERAAHAQRAGRPART